MLIFHRLGTNQSSDSAPTSEIENLDLILSYFYMQFIPYAMQIFNYLPLIVTFLLFEGFSNSLGTKL